MPQKPIIAGLDPSYTGFAVCVGDGQTDAVEVFKVGKQGESIAAKMKRLDMLVGDVINFLKEWQPDAIFIESYSFGSPHNRELMAELGAITRWHLVDLTQNVFNVAPTTLKKFATGSGKGEKSQMAAHVQKRWNRMFSTNDEVDAFAMYRLGLVASGIVEADNKEQREACKTVLKEVNLASLLRAELESAASAGF